MVFTEKEAEEKLCYLYAARRDGSFYCAGPSCMAWRWIWNGGYGPDYLKDKDGNKKGTCNIVNPAK
jgi:hypothetical protein